MTTKNTTLFGLILAGFVTSLICFAGATPAGSEAQASRIAIVDEDPASDARCGKCGDGSCVASCGETATTCPRDCGGGGETSAT